MPGQLTFDLPARPALGRGDFMVSASNRSALAAIDGIWSRGMLVLTGPRGAGKSHLALVWAAETSALLLNGRDLAALDPGGIDPSAVVIDDADASAGDPAAEQALFHLYNLMSAAGGKLLLAATKPPARWPTQLPDLASRLATLAVATLEPPDDLLLSSLLVKLFADRQLAVRAPVIRYLVQRMDRSFAAAGAVVEALDRLSLAEARPISRALAARVLDSAAKSPP